MSICWTGMCLSCCSSRRGRVPKIRDYHHGLMSLVDLPMVLGLKTRHEHPCTLRTLYTLTKFDYNHDDRLERLQMAAESSTVT